MKYQELPFLDVFKDATAGNVKTPQTEFLKEGRFPVVDQGQSLVAGFVNDKSRVCSASPPVIVFGDHTRAIKYVDFEFAMGADGTKVLVSKVESDTKYLYHALRAIEIPAAGYSRHYKFLKETKIPFPPLAEQQRIAGILDAADSLRAKRRDALGQLDSLLRSIFLDMFGDPDTNRMRWEEAQFGDIATDTKLGLVRSSKEFGWDFGIPYVRMNAVSSNGYFLPEEVQSTEANDEEVAVFSLQPGDFLFNTRNSKELVGKVCVFPGPEERLFNNNLMRVRFRPDVQPWVIAMQFRFRRLKRELEKRKSGTTSVFAIYWKSLRTLPVLVPPSDLQRNFAAIVEAVEHQKAIQHAHLNELDKLFASLQSRAFRGDL